MYSERVQFLPKRNAMLNKFSLILIVFTFSINCFAERIEISFSENCMREINKIVHNKNKDSHEYFFLGIVETIELQQSIIFNENEDADLRELAMHLIENERQALFWSLEKLSHQNESILTEAKKICDFQRFQDPFNWSFELLENIFSNLDGVIP